MTLTAYYPFTGIEGTAPGTNGIIEANTRVENQASDKQPGIDFLWDSQTGFTANEPEVNFRFTHKMSKLTLTFQRSDAVYDEITGKKLADGVEVSDMVSYVLKGLGLDGTFNTATGVCAVKSGASTDSLSIGVKNMVTDNVPLKPLILFPQTLNGGGLQLDIYTDELNDESALQHYHCTLSFNDGEIIAGYHYKYTIKVTKIGLIVGKMTVEKWFEQDRFMTATIDGDNVFEENK